MKIAWIINNINQVGGIEQVVCGLSSHFVSAFGYKVLIISVNTTQSNLFFPLNAAVEVRHCGLDWREQTRKKLGETIRTAIKDLDADILLTCHSPISNGVLMNRGVFKGKVIVTQHCACDFETKKRLLLNALMFRFSDAFVVLTENDRKIYKKMGCKSLVIPNAMFSTVNSASTLEEKILLGAGRLTEVKGFDHLICAFAKVAPKHPQWRLYICGDGSLAPDLKRQAEELNISDRVVFPGFVKMSEYLSRAGCFAISSHSEGFPLVLIEAMAHGLPIVGYALPALKEICGEHGALLASQDNVDALAEKLNHIFSSDELRYKLGHEALDVSMRYTVSSVAERWRALFEQLVSRKR